MSNPANGIYFHGVVAAPEGQLPDIDLPKILRLLEKCVIIDDRVVLAVPYKRRAFRWLLAQIERWGDEAGSDDERERVIELTEAFERHFERWQPR